MKEETKTCLKQPDEQLFIFASFELNCFNTVSERAQCRWGRGKKNAKQCIFFLLSMSQIDMPVPYSSAVMSRMSAGTQARVGGLHMGWVEAVKRPSAQRGRVIITLNDHAHAATEKKGE